MDDCIMAKPGRSLPLTSERVSLRIIIYIIQSGINDRSGLISRNENFGVDSSFGPGL